MDILRGKINLSKDFGAADIPSMLEGPRIFDGKDEGELLDMTDSLATINYI